MNAEILKQTIEEIRKKYLGIITDEASTKQVIILRTLNALDWNIFDHTEVTPEYIVKGLRVDFSLRIANQNKVFIEVKKIGEDLEGHEEQLLNYAFKEGVPLAVLTNGITWWLYLPLNEGSWEQRKFFTIDFQNQDTNIIVTKLISYLSKPEVLSGNAITNAKNDYTNERTKSRVKESIPKTWTRIISNQNEKLIELLEDEIERDTGIRPAREDLEEFLAGKGENDKVIEQPIIEQKQQIARFPKLNASRKNKAQIKGFVFLGKFHQASTLKDVMVGISQIIYDRHSSDFDRACTLRGPKREYFSKNYSKMREPRQIGNSQYYIETHWSRPSAIQICDNLIRLFGYKSEDFSVEFQES
jgi:hypothetical protein